MIKNKPKKEYKGQMIGTIKPLKKKVVDATVNLHPTKSLLNRLKKIEQKKRKKK